MRIAIAHWNERVSPVFDVSTQLVLLDIANGLEQKRQYFKLLERETHERARVLLRLRVDTLICGAVSRDAEKALVSAGINVFSFVCGDLEQILNAFIEKRLSEKRFLMPGHP